MILADLHRELFFASLSHLVFGCPFQPFVGSEVIGDHLLAAAQRPLDLGLIVPNDSRIDPDERHKPSVAPILQRPRCDLPAFADLFRGEPHFRRRCLHTTYFPLASQSFHSFPVANVVTTGISYEAPIAEAQRRAAPRLLG